MLWRMTPPAGEPCRLSTVAGHTGLGALYPAQAVLLTDSGSSALQLALRAALARHDSRRPEVILPAYGCPHLVAAVYAVGARPRLADLRAESPRMSLQAVRALLSPDTVAVIAAHFCGIPEDLPGLRSLLPGAVSLIEDSAQALALQPQAPPPGVQATVLSFGRGKPLTLLGGGALLSADPAFAQAARAALPGAPPAGDARGLRLRAAAYNRLRHPLLYGLLERLPLGLGQTRYRPLAPPAPLDAARAAALPGALARWQATPPPLWRPRLPSRCVDLPRQCHAPGPWLRYPILAASPTDAVATLARLRAAGIGATRMYGAAQPDLADMPQALSQPGLTAARDFAGRLLTLPCHSEIDRAARARIEAALHD